MRFLSALFTLLCLVNVTGSQETLDDRVLILLKQASRHQGADREKALAELARLGRRHVNVINTLADSITTCLPEELRYEAACALENLSSNGSIIGTLVKGLFDSSPRIRAKCALLLSTCGPRAEGWEEHLAAVMLRDSDPDVRFYLANALGSIGRRPDVAVPALMRALDDASLTGPQRLVAVNVAVVHALGRFGPSAIEAAPALEKIVRMRDHERRDRAMVALARVRPDKKTVELFRDMLRNPTEVGRWGQVATALGHAGPAAKDAVPDIAQLLRFRDPKDVARQDLILRGTLIGLQELGNVGKEAVPAVMELSGDQGVAFAVRSDALHALGYVPAEAEVIVPFLLGTLHDPVYAKLENGAANGLRRLGTAALPYLIEELKTNSKRDQAVTFNTLGALGPNAEAALPILHTGAGASQKSQSSWQNAIRSIESSLRNFKGSPDRPPSP